MQKYLQQLDVESDNFDRLPRVCLAVLPDGKKAAIKRGHKGYYEVHPAIDIDRFNNERGITEHQVDAMITGSMFGWDVPGADPAEVEKWDKERASA